MFRIWRVNIAAAAILLLANPSYAEGPSLLAAFPNEGGALTLYAAECSLEEAHECVAIIVGCEDSAYVDIAWGFSLTTSAFGNTEIADWLTAIPDDNDPSWTYQGPASIVIDGKSFDVFPMSLTSNELNAAWDLTVAVAGGDDPNELWKWMTNSFTWTIQLGDSQKEFALNSDAQLEFKKVAKTCTEHK